MSCSTDDLMQVMQRLMNERKKVKNLERQLTDFKKNPLKSDIPVFESAPIVAPIEKQVLSPQPPHDKEIEALKEQLKELNEKVKASQQAASLPVQQVSAPIVTAAPVAAPTPVITPVDENVSQLKQNLYYAQNEVRVVKERATQLEEEVRRLQQFRSHLQSELKDHSTKAQELDRLKLESLHYKNKLQEALTEVAALQDKMKALTASATIEQIDKAAFLEEKNSRERLEHDLEDQKLLFVEHSKSTKAQEAKMATLLAEKNRLFDEQAAKIQELYDTLNKTKADLQNSQNSFALLQAKLEGTLTQEKILSQDLMLKHERLIAIEKEAHTTREMLEEHKVTSSALRKQVDELEQHLARRVRECAILQGRLDDEASSKKRLEAAVQEKQTQLIAIERTLQQAQTLSTESSEQLHQLEEERQLLNQMIEEQADEITDLSEIKQKFISMYDLLKQCNELFEKPSNKLDWVEKRRRPAKISLKSSPHDLFTTGTTTSPTRHDLFE